VLLRVFVAADGRPTNVVVLKSSGVDMLDASAWRPFGPLALRPRTRNGIPVDDTVQVPIRFRQTPG